jgi:hypothetical protein
VEVETLDIQAIKMIDWNWQTEEACEDYLMNLRWANGFHCPRCDHHEAFHIRTRRLLECKECRMQVSITAGTIMHKSKLPLLTWFRAIHTLFEHEVGVTAYVLAEHLHINYRSAKLLIQKICFAFKIEEGRLRAFRQLKLSRAKSTLVEKSIHVDDATNSNNEPIHVEYRKSSKSTEVVPPQSQSQVNMLINSTSSKECSTYLVNYLQENIRSFNRNKLIQTSMKKLVSIHLYSRFLKCFQV